MFRQFAYAAMVGMGFAVGACGAADVHPDAPNSEDARHKSNVEVSELEISGTGLDRFTSCPPAGELGQDWIPTIPPWRAPAPSTSGEAPASLPHPPEDVTMHGQTPTERAIADTRESFRSCWHHSLIYDPTQNGHVAIVLRVGPDGRVARVEPYGACELSSAAIQCMEDVAKKLRFQPPAAGADTITVPAVFAGDDTHTAAPLPNGGYTVSAYLTIEGLRPALHACEESARRAGTPVATGTFALEVGPDGKVSHVNIDPWSGDRDLLSCAAAAFQAGQFAPPPGGGATIFSRLAFNPRAGTK